MIPALLAPLLAKQGSKMLAKVFDSGSKAAMEKAGSYIKEKTGIDINAQSLSDEQLAQIAQLEREHEKDLKQMFLADIQDARAMQVEALKQDDKFAKRFVYYFAAAWSLFAVGYLSAITFMAIPEQSVRFADTILGFTLGTLIATIIGYFYGNHDTKDS